MEKKHRKHAKLTLRTNGEFGPNELSFVGVKCSVISQMVSDISNRLASKYKAVYVDASHGKENTAPVFDTYTYHPSGDTQIATDYKMNKFNERIQFNQYDLICVNGNHYPASKQIVFLDAEKENSIQKRIGQLGAIQFFIRVTPGLEAFDCLLEKNPKNADVPVYELNDIEAITKHVGEICGASIAELEGLVLVGGKSTRMGTDKAQLEYHGIPQQDYAVQLLEAEGLKSYLSVRSDQTLDNKSAIADAFVGLGPFGAICSAFMKDPNKAYLVLATDLPYVNKELVQLLLSKRNPKKTATAIKGKSAKFMEPLITIWEPKAYPLLLNYLSQGYSCPRKILINSDVEIVEVDDNLIRNVNTPDEFTQVKSELSA